MLTSFLYQPSYQNRERAILNRLRRRTSRRPIRHLSLPAGSTQEEGARVSDISETREYERIIEALQVEKKREFRAEVSVEGSCDDSWVASEVC